MKGKVGKEERSMGMSLGMEGREGGRKSKDEVSGGRDLSEREEEDET